MPSLIGSGPRRAAAVAVGVLLAFVMGLALRLRLGSEDYWFNPDEGIYHQVATTPSTDEASGMIRGLVHPPLHYWVLRALAPMGDDARTLRLPSLAAGLLAILAFGWLGSGAGAAEGGPAGGVAGAWFGALVAALSPALALQSVTMRPYTLHALALALGLGALLRYRATGRSRWLVLFSVSFTWAALMLYSTYLVAGGLGIVLLGALVAGRLSRRQIAGLLAAALPVLTAMVWSYVTHLKPYVIGGTAHREAMETWLHGQYVTNPIAGVAALFRAANYAYGPELCGLVLPLVLFAVGLGFARRRGFEAFVALAVAGLAVALSWYGLVPLGGTRHSLYLIAVQVAAGATGIGWLARRASEPGAAEVETLRRRQNRLQLTGAVAALVVGLVGVRALRIARASATGAIDAEDEERVVRRGSVEAVSRFVARAQPTFWLTDLQTSMLLLPLAPREERMFRHEPALGGGRFEALGRSFAVLSLWALPEAPTGARDPVELALTWMSEHGGLSGGRVGVVTGGWGTSAAWRIARDLRAGGQRAAVLDAVGDERLAAVVVDVQALRSWRLRR